MFPVRAANRAISPVLWRDPYLPGNRIALIDFGMVGRLSPVRRHQVLALLAGLARQDEGAMLEVLLD